MISKEKQETLRRWINEYMTHLSQADRDEAFDLLINKAGATDIYMVYNGDHVARIGVKTQLGNGIYGKAYLSTEYDNEILDF